MLQNDPLLIRPLSHAQAEGGIEIGLLGTSVATEECGQVRGLKFRKTSCEYWSCLALTVIGRGAVMGTGGSTRNSGTGCPAAPVCAGMISGGWPGSKIGTSMVNSTVSIQNVAAMFTVWAFGALAVASPFRKAMLTVPPPNRGTAGWLEMEMMVVDVMACDAMWLRSRVLGSVSIACVMVPAAMKEVRFCGIRAVLLVAAVWLGKGILLWGAAVENGVMSTAGMVGFPAMVDEVPWASRVVPWGIDAMRTTVDPSAGAVVAGTAIHSPGSKWMPTGWLGTVTSLMVCR